jgi:hypothetical protein
VTSLHSTLLVHTQQGCLNSRWTEWIQILSLLLLILSLRSFPHFLYMSLVIRLLFRLPSLLLMLAEGTVWNVSEWGRNRLALTCISHVRSFPDTSVSGADELSASHLGLFASKEIHIGDHWIRGLEGSGVKRNITAQPGIGPRPSFCSHEFWQTFVQGPCSCGVPPPPGCNNHIGVFVCVCHCQNYRQWIKTMNVHWKKDHIQYKFHGFVALPRTVP